MTNSYVFYEVANSYDLTRTILYDLSKPQWWVGLGAGLGVGHSYKFIRIVQLVKCKCIWQKPYEFVQVRLYKFIWISHLVKYVRIAVRSGWRFPIRWSSTWRLRSLLQGTKVTYVTETLSFFVWKGLNFFFFLISFFLSFFLSFFQVTGWNYFFVVINIVPQVPLTCTEPRIFLLRSWDGQLSLCSLTTILPLT